jgi:hypothetical protein
MANENEQVEETQDETQDETQQENQQDSEETIDWQARAKDLEQKAIKQRENTKELKDKISKLEAQVKPEEKPDEPDYTKAMVEETFLETKGVLLDKQKEFVKKEVKETKKPLGEVLKFKYVQEELANIKTQAEAEAGMPQGSGQTAGKSSKNVDYWLQKGGVPEDDLELADKVIEARLEKEKTKDMFSKEMF